MEVKSNRQKFDEVPPPGAPSLAVFYDVSRLVNRAHGTVATGIDRIDLRFARAVLDRHGEDCHFVVRVRRRVVLAERSLIVALIDALERIWFDGGGHEPAILRGLEKAAIRSSLTDIRPDRPKSAAGWPSWLFGQARLAAVAARRRARNAMRRSAMPAIAKLCEGRAGVYITCSHTGLARQMGALAMLGRAGVTRTVAYIHDLIPIEYPEFTRAGQSRVFAGFLDELANAGADFIANSNDTARRLEAYAARKGWPTGPVSVVYPGIEGAPPPGRPPVEVDQTPYFVVVGTIEPRKNHLLLLRIWRELAQSGHAPMPRLHVVGKRGWENKQVFDILDHCPIVRDHVTEHNDMTDGELAALLQGARALLFPSFAEGYGLPLAEAVAAGVPVIASNLPVFREVVGDTVAYIDPLDAEGWLAAVMELARKPRAESGNHISASFPGWESSATNFLNLIAEN